MVLEELPQVGAQHFGLERELAVANSRDSAAVVERTIYLAQRQQGPTAHGVVPPQRLKIRKSAIARLLRWEKDGGPATFPARRDPAWRRRAPSRGYRPPSNAKRYVGAGISSPARFSGWTESINPWTQKERLPLLEGGLLADLVYGDEPRIVNDLHVDPEDPAAPYLEGMRSLMALPNYDQGQGLNFVLALRAEPDAFDPETLPERVWMSNLFGRATTNLVLKQDDRDSEMTVVRNEFERGENEPDDIMQKDMYAMAFREHPYQIPTIGYRSDVENVPMARLRAFYETFYWPNNATVIVVGDFEPERALKLISRHFGKIRRSPQPIPAARCRRRCRRGPGRPRAAPTTRCPCRDIRSRRRRGSPVATR